MDEREELLALRRLAELEARAGQSAAPVQAQAKPPEWRDLPGNIIPSGQKFVGGLVDMVTSPIQTAKSVADLGAGALRAGVGYIAPGLVERLDRLDNPEVTQRLQNVSTAAGEALVGRYGSLENAKQTLIQDPVGAAADLSTVFTGGAMVAPRAGLVANTLRTAARFTDPLSVPVAAVKPLASLLAKPVAPIIGMTTGVGAENLRTAYQTGREGGESAQTFRDNMLGRVDQTDVLAQAKQGLANIRDKSQVTFRNEAGRIMPDPTLLDMSPIVRKGDELLRSVEHRGVPTVSPAEYAEIQGLLKIVDDWRNNPQMHDVSGLDALKRRLDAAWPESSNHRQAQRIATTLRNEVKDTIVAQEPKYAGLMQTYEDSLRLQKEIEASLSLGRKSSQDTALRKLQSLGRSNVATNYGGRLNMARELKKEGGVDIMPAIAGQSTSSLMPRGIQSLAGVGSLGAAFMHPGFIAALPFQSPRAMGAAAHGLGMASRFGSRLPRVPLTALQRLNSLGELEQKRRAQQQNQRVGIY